MYNSVAERETEPPSGGETDEKSRVGRLVPADVRGHETNERFSLRQNAVQAET